MVPRHVAEIYFNTRTRGHFLWRRAHVIAKPAFKQKTSSQPKKLGTRGLFPLGKRPTGGEDETDNAADC